MFILAGVQCQAQLFLEGPGKGATCRVRLSVPIQIKRRGGRKVVRLPDGNALKPRPID